MTSDLFYEQTSGLNYSWLCCDAEDRLGEFYSQSIARIPSQFSQDFAKYEEVIRVLSHEAWDSLPVGTGFEFGSNATAEDRVIPNRLENIQQSSARQGMFVFSADELTCGNQYYLAYVPKRPSLLNDLPDGLRSRVECYRVEFLFHQKELLSEVEIVDLFGKS